MVWWGKAIEREYGSDVSLGDLLKLWSPRSLFVFESPQKETPDAPSESRMKLKKGKEKKKTADAFPFLPSSPAPNSCKWLFAVPSHIVRMLMDANCFGNWRGNG